MELGNTDSAMIIIKSGHTGQIAQYLIYIDTCINWLKHIWLGAMAMYHTGTGVIMAAFGKVLLEGFFDCYNP